MEMTFRWYGKEDPVTLKKIRQIPLMKGIVSAIYDIPVGEVWSREKIRQLKQSVEEENLTLSVVESVPVHEDIKLGKATRDALIDNYIKTLTNLAQEGIRVVCYNFMPVFDWTRTQLDYSYEDGSTALIFDVDALEQLDPSNGELRLPGWDSSYQAEQLAVIMQEYQDMDDETLWSNLSYFIQRVIPEAEKLGIKLALHPDDPPFSIFGLPRIITDLSAVERFLNIYDSPSNCMTLCVGSFASRPDNDAVEILRYALQRQRVAFVHARNVKVSENYSFKETAHPSSYGSIDMYEVVKVLHEFGYTGPIRPDHGRMIWKEEGRAGYGLFDRALGAMYLSGLYEAVQKRGAKHD